MSKLSRTKGRAFEQRIARILRARFPQCEVRRSSQADRAVQSDVYVTGHSVLERIWWELTDGRAPNVRGKLEQAERDVAEQDVTRRAHRLNYGIASRLPVVVWHVLGKRETIVTMRLWVLGDVIARSPQVYETSIAKLLVTMELGEFLEMVA